MAIGLQHHILQFDVSMDDSKAVEVINRARLEILHEHVGQAAMLVRLTNSADASFL
jgi:hypothetical protein